MTAYLDTSAAAKLLVDEAESMVLASYLDRVAGAGVPLVSSILLETELRRLAVRESLGQTAVSAVLARVDLAEPDRSLFYLAGILPGPRLRSLDALHVATAARLTAELFVTYDVRQIEAAASVGLNVVSPD